jgi:hypothetical protein
VLAGAGARPVFRYSVLWQLLPLCCCCAAAAAAAAAAPVAAV